VGLNPHILNTQHRDNSVVADAKNKPEIITYYNSTKSGVDILDKLVRTYSCKRATARWTVTFFFNLVHIAAYNALVLWITMNPNWHQGKSNARRLFLLELGMSLTNDHVSERLTRHSGKRRRIQECAGALVVVAFLPIDRHRHHQRAAAMGVGDGVTPVRVSWNAKRHAPATSVACPSPSSTSVLMTCLECALRIGGWTVDRLISSRIR